MAALGHDMEAIIEAQLIAHGARVNAGTWRLACDIADALVAGIPALQLVEIVTDHPGPASLHIDSNGGTEGSYATVRWNAAGRTSADDESGHGATYTLAGAIADALRYGTPHRPKAPA